MTINVSFGANELNNVEVCLAGVNHCGTATYAVGYLAAKWLPRVKLSS